MHQYDHRSRRLRADEKARHEEDLLQGETVKYVGQIEEELERLGGLQFQVPNPYYWTGIGERATVSKSEGGGYEIVLERGLIDRITIDSNGSVIEGKKIKIASDGEEIKLGDSEFLNDTPKLQGLLKHLLDRVRSQG